MDILIVGTGALACLFAARLVDSGIEVAILGNWKEGLAALHSQGVSLHELDGSTRTYPIKVMEGPSAEGNYRYSLVLVKAWQTERAAKQLAPCLSTDGIVLTLQNGLGNDEILKRILRPERVALGVTTVGARMLEPGHVQFTGDGKVFVGTHRRLGELANVIKNAGFRVEMISDPVSLLWGKLVINAAINPLTGILRLANGEILERPAARELLAEAAREAALVATRQGITLPFPAPVIAVEEVARGTASNYSSMLQDVLRGRVTEIEAINGAVVREGERLGIPTPINRVLWRLVESLDHH